jgi:hypothetical protein
MRAAQLPPESHSSQEVTTPPAAARPGVVSGATPGAATNGNGRKTFPRVPTHAVGVASDRRIAPRAKLGLSVRLMSAGGQNGCAPRSLRTSDISATGAYLLSPERLEPGTPVELNIQLIRRPRGKGGVQLETRARVVRTDLLEPYGWHGLAVQFEEIGFQRDEFVPARFQKT